MSCFQIFMFSKKKKNIYFIIEQYFQNIQELDNERQYAKLFYLNSGIETFTNKQYKRVSASIM